MVASQIAPGSVVPYQHELATAVVHRAYHGGVYSPNQDRIYFVPYRQANESTWHYVDCATGSIVPYPHGLATAAVNGAYFGGVYSPSEVRAVDRSRC